MRTCHSRVSYFETGEAWISYNRVVHHEHWTGSYLKIFDLQPGVVGIRLVEN